MEGSIFAEAAAYGGNSNEAVAWLEAVGARLTGASGPTSTRVRDHVALSPFLILRREDCRWSDW